MTIEWSGPTGGIGNRMLALSSVSALSRMLDTEIRFTWDDSPVCPCSFSDLFAQIEGAQEGIKGAGCARRVETCGWHPLRIRKAFETLLGVRIREDDFYYGMIRAMRGFRYDDAVNAQVAESGRNRGGKEILSVHLRRGDRYEHHHRVYRFHLYAFSIIKNTGFKKSLQYLLLSENRLRKIENENIRRLVEMHLNAFANGSYSLYGDSKGEIGRLAGFLRTSGIPPVKYSPGFCCHKKNERLKAFGIRDTYPREALVELLEMSTSCGIVQNTPASTFSLVAAIIGRAAIKSQQPSHAFWVRIREVLGTAPNEIET